MSPRQPRNRDCPFPPKAATPTIRGSQQAIHYRTSRAFSSQGRTPQRTPSHLRSAMSFAISPGYPNAMVRRLSGSLLGSASTCEATTTSAVERSERSTAARAGIAETPPRPGLGCRCGRAALWSDWPSLAKEKMVTVGGSRRSGCEAQAHLRLDGLLLCSGPARVAPLLVGDESVAGTSCRPASVPGYGVQPRVAQRRPGRRHHGLGPAVEAATGQAARPLPGRPR